MTFEEFQFKYQKQEVVNYPHKVSPHPLVSVLVQTFQHREYIKICLDSILNQVTTFPFEILLGEDESTDGTRELCIQYAEKFPEKIRLFLHDSRNKIKINNISTGNFNALTNFYSARGKYIAFCEGDDYWKDPLKLQKQVDLLAVDSKYILSYHSYIETDAAGNLIPDKKTLKQSLNDIKDVDLQCLAQHPLLSTICFRNVLNREIPEEIAEVINVDSFLISLLGNFGSAKFQNEIENSLYRKHPGGIWSNKSKRIKLRTKINTYKKLRNFYCRKNDFETAETFSKKIRNTRKTQIANIFRTFGINL